MNYHITIIIFIIIIIIKIYDDMQAGTKHWSVTVREYGQNVFPK